LRTTPSEDGDSKQLIEFPANFQELLDMVEADEVIILSFALLQLQQSGEGALNWAKEMLGLPSELTDKDEKVIKGLQAIRKLDLILARKTNVIPQTQYSHITRKRKNSAALEMERRTKVR
jgi:hypothetical protein